MEAFNSEIQILAQGQFDALAQRKRTDAGRRIGNLGGRGDGGAEDQSQQSSKAHFSKHAPTKGARQSSLAHWTGRSVQSKCSLGLWPDGPQNNAGRARFIGGISGFEERPERAHSG
jgi:hypothetical protein